VSGWEGTEIFFFFIYFSALEIITTIGCCWVVVFVFNLETMNAHNGKFWRLLSQSAPIVTKWFGNFWHVEPKYLFVIYWPHESFKTINLVLLAHTKKSRGGNFNFPQKTECSLLGNTAIL
jgi:hypothetical protein